VALEGEGAFERREHGGDGESGIRPGGKVNGRDEHADMVRDQVDAAQSLESLRCRQHETHEQNEHRNRPDHSTHAGKAAAECGA
jgi:hypothetical protein